jgi:hypothetical protein
MGLEFTRMNVFKTDSKQALDVDTQIVEFIKLLDSKLATWQVIAPTANQRILYYELEHGEKPKKVTGSALAQRLEHLGEIKKTKRG